MKIPARDADWPAAATKGSADRVAGRSLFIGAGSAIFILAMWSGFIVFNRFGVLGGLTPYDMAAARLMVAGPLSLPFLIAWWPRHLPWQAIVVMTLCGPGVLYSILVPAGLAQASAAYGGVFTNGALPVLTMLIAFCVAGTRPTWGHIIGTAVILTGGTMVAWRGLQAGGTDVATGIALFLGASTLVGSYIYAIRHWSVTPREALVLVNVPNALIYLPIWALFLPSSMADAPIETVVWQMAFQGLGPGFLAVIVFAMMAYHLGPTPTAAVSAAVPASAALLAIPVLSEQPTPLEWAGIATVTVGLMLLTWRR
ncbi:MAG: DMT family transporter [Pseudomonadota bacterium]